MNLDLKKVSLVLGIVISLTTITYGTIKYLNTTYAYAADLKELKTDTKYQFLHIKIDKLNNRIWELEGRIEKKPADKDAKKELDSLKLEKEITVNNIKEIEKSKLQEK